jgi:hypothetical protein
VIGRVLAWLFVALGLGVFAYDLWIFLDSGAVRLTALGQLWYWLDPGSLNLAQAVIERYIHPFLWDPIIINVLLAPASLVFLVIGIVLGLIFRRRKRRRR